MKKTKSISLSKVLLLVGALFVVNFALAIGDDMYSVTCIDFENDTLGTLYPDVQDVQNLSFYLYVEEDPTNAVNETTGQVNKVLHVENTGAGESNYVLPVFDITLPTGVTVADLETFTFDMYCLTDNASYNNFRFYVFPADGSWSNWGWGSWQCNTSVNTYTITGGVKNAWVSCTMTIHDNMEANSNYETMKTWNTFQFSFGEENYAAHYYLDNIGFTYNGGNSGTIVITSAGYATFYTRSEYTMPEGVTGTIVTGVEDEEQTDGGYLLNTDWGYTAGSTVPAKTALVLKGEAGTYTYTITSTDATAPTDNLLLGSTTSTETYGPDEEATYVFYELTNGDYDIGFYYGAADGAAFTSAANKAWLPLTTTQAAGARFIGFGDGGDTTGISSVEANDGAKVSGIYTIQGVRVSDMSQKGIYIVDGRKILVK